METGGFFLEEPCPVGASILKPFTPQWNEDRNSDTRLFIQILNWNQSDAKINFWFRNIWLRREISLEESEGWCHFQLYKPENRRKLKMSFISFSPVKRRQTNVWCLNWFFITVLNWRPYFNQSEGSVHNLTNKKLNLGSVGWLQSSVWWSRPSGGFNHLTTYYKQCLDGYSSSSLCNHMD